MLKMSDQVFNNANRKLMALIKISRPIGWPIVVLVSILCMMTFQVALHNPAYQVGLHNPGLIGLAILAFFFTAAGGYAINDYVDRESDAIVKPDRPIPSNQITPLGALQFSAIMFISALGVGLMINPLAFGIVIFNISFLLLYSSFVKKYSGFLSNIAIGLVEGITIPIFAEAALFQRVSVVSLSFMGFILVGIGINVLKDVAGVEGDKTIGVSSLAIKRGKPTAVRVGALFLVATAISLIVPYVEGVVTIAYLVPMALMGGIILHVASSLFKKTDAQDVKKLLKLFRTSLLILFPVALIVGTFLLR
jgi:geranylgeranylglycerol-phosphate geranylgeranyltransferase